MIIGNIFCSYFMLQDSYFIKSISQNEEKMHLHFIHYQNWAIFIIEATLILSILWFIDFSTFKDIETD